MELKILKTYIQTNLANGFIQLSKFFADVLILFVYKSNSKLQLCIDYQGPNNLTINNGYPLLLIGEFLDRLGRVKRFTLLKLTNA